MSTFSPTEPNPGAGGIPGAMIFAGTGPGRTGSGSSRTFPRMPGVPEWALPTSSTRSRRCGADTASTTRTSRSLRALNPPRASDRPVRPERDEWIGSGVPPGPGFPQDRVQFPPLIDPTINLGGSPVGITVDGLTLPRFQNWSTTYQRQVTGNTMLSLSTSAIVGAELNHHGSMLSTPT